MLIEHKIRKHNILTTGYIVSDSTKCVQCGICTYNCPIGIDVRSNVWHQITMKNNQCLGCGECIARCPRGVLRFEKIDISSGKSV